MIIKTLVEDTTSKNNLRSEHGLSLYIETSGKKILFDSGTSGLFMENAIKMGIDISKIDYAIISHGHNDHGGGLERFFEANSKAEVFIHESAFDKHYSLRNGSMVYIGLDDQGNKKGISFKATGSGFNGPIEIMVGYNPGEGKLLGIEILSMSETPGLGARIKEGAFTEQFKGKSAEDKFVAKEDVQAVSGATISSTAVANAIKTSLDKIVKIYPVGGDF